MRLIDSGIFQELFIYLKNFMEFAIQLTFTLRTADFGLQ